jgi:hypothetical protein
MVETAEMCMRNHQSGHRVQVRGRRIFKILHKRPLKNHDEWDGLQGLHDGILIDNRLMWNKDETVVSGCDVEFDNINSGTIPVVNMEANVVYTNNEGALDRGRVCNESTGRDGVSVSCGVDGALLGGTTLSLSGNACCSGKAIEVLMPSEDLVKGKLRELPVPVTASVTKKIQVWEQELGEDPERDFILQGMTHGFKILNTDSVPLTCVKELQKVLLVRDILWWRKRLCMS